MSRIAGVQLGLGALLAALGVSGIGVARFVPGRVTLPGVILDSDDIRAAATALCLFIVVLGAINGVSSAGVLLGRVVAWAPSVVASGLTAAVLGWAVTGLLFQRGVGPLPGADAAALAAGTLAAMHAAVCVGLVRAGWRP